MSQRFLCVLLVVLVGCVDPVSFQFKEQQEHLVVEAKFTNIASLNYVKLSESQSYNSPYNVFVEDAEVYISSEEGEYYPFYYSGSGFYYPEGGTQGMAGHTYTLHADGYVSQPVTMQPVVPIDSVYYDFNEQTQPIEGEPEARLQTGYQFLVDYEDPAGADNYYRWSYQLDYEVETQPEKHMRYDCRECPLPDPLPCCKQCWIQELRDEFAVSDDRLADGQKVLQ